MSSGLDRLVRLQLDRVADVPDWPEAVVKSIAVGGGTDGLDLVTVSYQGATLALPHYAHYTPAVGHVVTLIRAGGTWRIFGRSIGFPP